ncbi:MAG: DUF1476 domain-containing protein [Hyphomicrobium sp.]|jgi:hypothetical protein
MTTFDKREKAYENMFARDSELKFKAESRRNKALAEWAGGLLGLTGAALDDYIKDVRKADLAEKGDDDVFRKVKADLVAKGVSVSDEDIRNVMHSALAKAVNDLEKPAS